MRLIIQYALIEVGDGPAERNVEVEQFRQLIRSLFGIAVSPGLERGQECAVFAESNISVHHGGYADGTDRPQFHSVLRLRVLSHIGIAVPQPPLDLLKAVCPDSVYKRILPVVEPDGQYMTVQVREHSLDPRRAKFNSQRRFAGFNHFPDIHNSPVLY